MSLVPHPKLVPLLTKHGISHTDFVRKGRPLKGTGDALVQARSAIITELHSQGTSWAEMVEVTGLGLGSIQRLTKAMWNPASRETVKANGVRVGSSWKGKARPGQLEAQWAAGVFDFHRGRVWSDTAKQALRDGWTQECRRACSERVKRYWMDPLVRAKIMAFHTSPEERAKRSRAQIQRLRDHPGRYLRGKAQWVDTPKGIHSRAYARSSYEVAAIHALEADPLVLRYEHERVLALPDGHWILPDFIVEYTGGRAGIIELVEVKAAWVMSQPDDSKVAQRLTKAREFAVEQGWSFTVWTERELGC